MKIESGYVPKPSDPVTITLENQEEVDMFYAIFAALSAGKEEAYGVTGDVSWRCYQYFQQLASQKPLPRLNIEVVEDYPLYMHLKDEE